MKFSELQLHPQLLTAIEKLKFVECTPVQTATIPHVLEGRDVAGLAQTGTGKTAAFLLPLMDRMIRSLENPEQLSEADKEMHGKRAFPDWKPNQFILVLVPTRELAEQVWENANSLRGDSNLKTVSIYGGVSYDKQKQGLRDGVEIIVATPGRLLDLYKEHLVDLKQCRAIVFDEADRMFDMGFKEDMKFILGRVPKTRQFLVFSATLNLDVMNTAYQFGANPIDIDVSRDQPKAENVVDQIFHVGQEEKPAYLLSVLRFHKPRQAIVFSNFKMNVPRLTKFLNDNEIPAVGISSLLTQSQRTRVMEQFKSDNDQNILVATDVAARGLDIKGVDMVVNFELPDDPENYVHRIGRTGRAGEKGNAYSLVSDRDLDALTRVEEYLRHKVDIGFLEEKDIVKEYTSLPSERDSYRGDRPRESGGHRAQGGGGRGERPRREGARESSREGSREGSRPGGGRSGGRDQGRRDGVRPHQGRPERTAGAPGEARVAGEGRPRIERNQDSRPNQAASGGNQHRDRASGRHRADEQQQNRPGARGPERNSRGPRPERHEGQRAGSHGNGQNGHGKIIPRNKPQGGKSARGKGQQTPPAGIGKKVAGFFKRIFGA